MANLTRANLTGANLSRADLQAAILVQTDLTGADLTGSRIYGISAWGLKLSESTKQQNLIITRINKSRSDLLGLSGGENEPNVTVDDIEVAQFIYLLLNNNKIRNVIDTITSKAVLILGRFTKERKAVLHALRSELRKRGYLPILFDFEGPTNRNTDETITLLAGMARFVIADISDAKSVLQELRTIVPNLPTLPVQPVIVATQEEPGMFDFYRHFPWFLKVHRYDSQTQLLTDLGEQVIGPAERKVEDLRQAAKDIP
jgi:Pentapeptide repeats (8 copies)